MEAFSWEEAFRFLVTYLVYVGLNLLSWYNYDHYLEPRPWRCAMSGFLLSAVGMTFGGYQLWVERSSGAMIAIP